MKKLRKIIKDIVRQQNEYHNKMNSNSRQQHVRVMSQKKMIITEDGVGRA